MKQDLLIPPDVPLGMTSIPPELWTFYDDDFYDRKEGLIEQLKTRQMRDTNGSDIYITIETDPRMFVDGSLDTIDDFVALIPDKYKDMFSCAGLVGVYPAQHIVSVWWSLTLKNEYSEYIDQIMSDFLNKDCVVGFDVSAFYYEGLCTSTEVVWRYIYGVDYKANEIYF